MLSPTRIALRIAEQIVDIPASVCGVSGSLQGSLPEQISAQRTASQIADIPVPGRGVSGSLQGSLPEQSTAKRTASQIADIPVPGRGGSGCLLGFPPEQRTTALHVSQERDRVQELLVPSSSPTLFLLEVLTVFSQDSFQRRLLDLFTLTCTCPTLPSGWSSTATRAGPTSGTGVTT